MLVLEGSPAQLLDMGEGSLAVDSLIRLLHEYGCELLLLPSGIAKHRRALGEWVARLLINRTLYDNPTELVHSNSYITSRLPTFQAPGGSVCSPLCSEQRPPDTSDQSSRIAGF